MTYDSRVLTHWLVPSATVVGLATLALLAAFVLVNANKQDQLAEQRSIASMQLGLDHMLAAVSRTAGDYATGWTEAYVKLVLEPNADWADRNVGHHIPSTFGPELTFVLDPDGTTSYAAVDGARTPRPVEDFLGPGLAALVEAAAPVDIDEAAPVQGFVRAGETVMLVSVAPILPAAADGLELPEPPFSTLVLSQRLGPALIAELAGQLQAERMRVLPAGASPGEARLPLRDPHGREIAVLAWQPPLPGRESFRALAPALPVVLVVIGLFVGGFLRGAQGTARRIALSEARFRDIAEAASDWIWETDAKGRVLFLSQRFAEVTGLAVEEVVGRPWQAVLRPCREGRGRQALRRALADEAPFRDVVCRFAPATGIERTVRVAGKPRRDGQGRLLGYRGTATDITAEIAAEAQAQYLAYHDPVTGLPNRRLLGESLERALAEARSGGPGAAVLMLDLDRFKEVNDSLGHAAGDRLLAICAERLRRCARETDLVARIGGDEFAILQGEVVSLDGPEQLAGRILAALAEPFALEGATARVTTSIGIACMPEDGEHPGELLQHADIALYRAKAHGRNRACRFDHGMAKELRASLELEAELHGALGRGELELHYQPVVELGARRILAVEALLRWRHPCRGLLAAADFLQLAESSGLILPIGAWVLHTACRQAAAWPEVGVTVNLSPVQLVRDDIAATVAGALAETGLAPRRLELEVSEAALAADGGAALVALGRLHDLGVGIALDDFGTGYATLGHLQRFPFSRIKLDRTLVGGPQDERRGRAVVQSVIDLGRHLGAPVCAEGVESEDELARLRSQGCREAQGYFLGGPLPAAEIQGLLARQRERSAELVPGTS